MQIKQVIAEAAIIAELGIIAALLWKMNSPYIFGVEQSAWGVVFWGLFLLILYTPIATMQLRRLRAFGVSAKCGRLFLLAGLSLFVSFVLTARLTTELVYSQNIIPKDLVARAVKEGVPVQYCDYWFHATIERARAERDDIAILSICLLILCQTSYAFLRMKSLKAVDSAAGKPAAAL